MFPHLRYFAYYIARGVLATSNTSTPDTAIMENALSGKHEHHVCSLIAKRLATNSSKGDIFGGVYATLLLQSLQGEPRPDDSIFPFVSLDPASMKRHFFVTKGSDRFTLDYILQFKDGATRTVRLPAPLVFDFSRGNGYRFSVAEFDEITGRYQYHDPTEGVEPDEGEHVVYPPAQEEHEMYSPVQEETVTPGVKGLPLDGGRHLPLPHGRIPGCRCMPPTSPTTHGRTSTTREQEAPRDRSRRAQLRPKA